MPRISCFAERLPVSRVFLPRAQCFPRQMGIQTSPTLGTSWCKFKLSHVILQWLQDEIAYRARQQRLKEHYMINYKMSSALNVF